MRKMSSITFFFFFLHKLSCVALLLMGYLIGSVSYIILGKLSAYLIKVIIFHSD